MLDGLITAGGKVLGGARFSLLSVLPGVLVTTVIAALWRAHLYDPGSRADFDAILPTAHDTAAVVLFVFFAFVGGVLLRPFEAVLVQALEGYWALWYPLAILKAGAEEHHRRRRYRAVVTIDHAERTNSDWDRQPRRTPPPVPGGPQPLQELAREARDAARRARVVARARQIRSGYPTELRHLDSTSRGDKHGEIMPTLLGNALMRAERLSGDRYGLDMMTAYPRLYPFLSPRLEGSVSRQLDLISATASMCVSLTVIAFGTLPLIVRLDVWSVVPLVLAALAVLAYRGAVTAALYHGTLLATVFDLHRFDLIKAFHYPVPETTDGLVSLNMAITSFLQKENRRLDTDGGIKNDVMKHPPESEDVLQRTDRDGSAQP
jgi:hypothetical protein